MSNTRSLSRKVDQFEGSKGAQRNVHCQKCLMQEQEHYDNFDCSMHNNMTTCRNMTIKGPSFEIITKVKKPDMIIISKCIIPVYQ